MLDISQKYTIANIPTFKITQSLPNGKHISIRGFRDKSFIEVALIDADGHIDHNPPFDNDGFGIATFFRSDIAKIENLIKKLYYNN